MSDLYQALPQIALIVGVHGPKWMISVYGTASPAPDSKGKPPISLNVAY